MSKTGLASGHLIEYAETQRLRDLRLQIEGAFARAYAYEDLATLVSLLRDGANAIDKLAAENLPSRSRS